MYSKMTNDKDGIELPPNYGGSVFGRRESAPRFMPPQGMAARRPTREYAPPAVVSEFHDVTDRDSSTCKQQADEIPRCDTARGEAPRCEDTRECDEECNKCHEKHEENDRENSKKPSLFPSLSSIGTEELLLIAVALMVFQGGKEPDLSLILLALLFIN